MVDIIYVFTEIHSVLLVSVNSDITHAAKEKLFHAPAGASSVMEALQQRLDKFRSTALSAKEEGNSSKARRLDRIVQVCIIL